MAKVTQEDKVRTAQGWLNSLVVPSPNLALTGKLDAPTVAALNKFQVSRGLPATRTITKETWEAFGRAVGTVGDILRTVQDLPFAVKRLITGTPSAAFRFHRRTFFAGYMKRFGGLSGSQVGGIDQLLRFIEDDPAVSDLRWAAYMLVTVKLECADTWQPIEEFGCNPTTGCKPIPDNDRKYGRPRACPADLSKIKLKGVPLTSAAACPCGAKTHTYYGRGYVQITHPENYKKLGVALGLGETLLHQPERVLDPRTAYRIMSVGMRDGMFTGRKLSDYIHGKKCDYYNARRIINGIPAKAVEHVKAYAKQAEFVEGLLSLSLVR